MDDLVFETCQIRHQVHWMEGDKCIWCGLDYDVANHKGYMYVQVFIGQRSIYTLDQRSPLSVYGGTAELKYYGGDDFDPMLKQLTLKYRPRKPRRFVRRGIAMPQPTDDMAVEVCVARYGAHQWKPVKEWHEKCLFRCCHCPALQYKVLRYG